MKGPLIETDIKAKYEVSSKNKQTNNNNKKNRTARKKASIS